MPFSYTERVLATRTTDSVLPEMRTKLGSYKTTSKSVTFVIVTNQSVAAAAFLLFDLNSRRRIVSKEITERASSAT